MGRLTPRSIRNFNTFIVCKHFINAIRYLRPLILYCLHKTRSIVELREKEKYLPYIVTVTGSL